jgi:hypothetical protein
MREVHRLFFARGCTWFWVSLTRQNSGVEVSVITFTVTCKLNNMDCISNKINNNKYFQCY